jgi:hypothetical protein
MRKLAVIYFIFCLFLLTSCTAVIQKRAACHSRDFSVTYDDGRGETELFSMDHDDSPWASSFFMSMPFFSMDVYSDKFSGESYVDIDILK